MYNTIINPITNRKININSKLGRNIIKKYLIQSLKGGVYFNDGTWPGTRQQQEDARDAFDVLNKEIEAAENPGNYPYISQQRERKVREDGRRNDYQEGYINEQLSNESFRTQNEISYWKRRIASEPILGTLINYMRFGSD